MCINSRPSRRPSIKVVNQNGSVQLGEKAADIITFIYYTLENSVLSLARHLYISIILLCEGYALLKCFSLLLGVLSLVVCCPSCYGFTCIILYLMIIII